jgi:hypothetical protein
MSAQRTKMVTCCGGVDALLQKWGVQQWTANHFSSQRRFFTGSNRRVVNLHPIDDRFILA